MVITPSLRSRDEEAVTVSVVIPAFNAARFLQQAIDSVLAQTLRPCEVLVVDDGSTDNTIDVALAYGPPVRVLRKPNSGVAEARNYGIRHCSGLFVAFLDADDEWAPDKLRIQAAAIRENPNLDLVACGVEIIDALGRTLERYSEPPRFRCPRVEQLLYRNLLPTSSVLVRRRILTELGVVFDQRFSPIEDWHLWLRVATTGRMMVLPDQQVRYRLLRDSLTRSCQPERFRLLYSALYEDLERLPRRAEIIRSNRSKLSANVDIMVGHHLYENGQRADARRLIAKALVRDPLAPRWRAALGMLCLPRVVRNNLRRFFRFKFKASPSVLGRPQADPAHSAAGPWRGLRDL